jgi:cation:H+ antiporter
MRVTRPLAGSQRFFYFLEKKLITTSVALVASIFVIYVSCEFFVNAIEWVGKRFNVPKNAIGTILAAFGTALPESIVTLVAVVMGNTPEQKNIGVGAALGGPLVLSTIAYAVVGASLMAFHRSSDREGVVCCDCNKLSVDQIWFLIIFMFKILLGFVVFSLKPLTGFLFLTAYGIYCYREMSAREKDDDIIEPLRLRPKKEEPETVWIVVQTFMSLFFVFIGSHVFVNQLEALSLSVGIPAHVVALLLSPVATELPEILNAVIWVRQGKEMLALSNISGAMMIQATVPSAFGLFFTPWLFDTYLTAAGIVTALSIGFLCYTLRCDKLSPRRLTFAAPFYLIFAATFVL